MKSFDKIQILENLLEVTEEFAEIIQHISIEQNLAIYNGKKLLAELLEELKSE